MAMQSLFFRWMPGAALLLGIWIAALLFASSPAGSTDGSESGAPPEALAKAFMAAFAGKDMERVGSMFLPTAVVQRARLGGESPELAQFTAESWLEEATAAIAGVNDLQIDVLDAKSVAFEGGVTVSVHFRATGWVGEGVGIVNDGVDTFSLVPVDGDWRIVLYNSFEKLRFATTD